MNDNKKQSYLAPAVKVVEMKVERGFNGTFTAQDASVNPPTNGTETYAAGNADGWF